MISAESMPLVSSKTIRTHIITPGPGPALRRWVQDVGDGAGSLVPNDAYCFACLIRVSELLSC